MRGAGLLLSLEYAVLTFAAPENARPRGVGPEFGIFYKESKPFSCITHPSITIPYAQVNDDYCDCPDGSDEPGTAACAHLSALSPQTPANTNRKTENASLVLPGFYCNNKGHIPSYVPFTSVNDGVCDYDLCCDGSEEFGGVGGIKCENRCKEIGKEWRKADETRQKSLGNASKKRRELITEAGRLRRQIEDAVKDSSTLAEALEVKVRAADEELQRVTRTERGKYVKEESEKKGKTAVLVELAKQRVAELKDNLRVVRERRDESKTRLQELEQLLSTFKEEYNPNFNDEGVKRAVRAWEDYAAREKLPDLEAAQERDIEASLNSDEENGLDWSEFEDGEEDDGDVLYDFVNYLPTPLGGWVDKKLRDVRIALIDNGILADNAPKSGETKAVADARSRLEFIQKELEESREKISDYNTDLGKDWGPDDIFRALKGKCIDTDSGEYTYELCFMEHTTQKPKKGGGHTNMGNFASIERINVDEERPANGKGLGSGERIAMKYENGQHCWNGPNRRTTVILGCSEESEIWKIMEEEKCVYRMEVGTPAACEPAKAERAKDEL